MSEGGAQRWLKYGLFGCLGCLGLVVVLIGLGAGTAWLRARSAKVENEVLRQPAPPAAVTPEAATPPPSPPASGAPAVSSHTVPASRGVVRLDLHEAEFHIEPAPAGEPIRVEAHYDRNSYRLEESSGTAPDGSWTYSITFRRAAKAAWWIDLIQKAFSGDSPSVKVFLPRGTPISLEVQIAQGGLEAELGGLDLADASLQVSMGGIELGFHEPTARPLERLEVRTEMGGASLRSIGNASPRVLEVSYRMGGMDCDLTGAWSADASITVRGGMGGATVTLPRDVRVEGVPGRAFEGPRTTETSVPTLRFDPSSQLDEVQFRP